MTDVQKANKWLTQALAIKGGSFSHISTAFQDLQNLNLLIQLCTDEKDANYQTTADALNCILNNKLMPKWDQLTEIDIQQENMQKIVQFVNRIGDKNPIDKLKAANTGGRARAKTIANVGGSKTASSPVIAAKPAPQPAPPSSNTVNAAKPALTPIEKKSESSAVIKPAAPEPKKETEKKDSLSALDPFASAPAKPKPAAAPAAAPAQAPAPRPTPANNAPGKLNSPFLNQAPPAKKESPNISPKSSDATPESKPANKAPGKLNSPFLNGAAPPIAPKPADPTPENKPTGGAPGKLNSPFLNQAPPAKKESPQNSPASTIDDLLFNQPQQPVKKESPKNSPASTVDDLLFNQPPQPVKQESPKNSPASTVDDLLFNNSAPKTESPSVSPKNSAASTVDDMPFNNSAPKPGAKRTSFGGVLPDPKPNPPPGVPGRTSDENATEEVSFTEFPTAFRRRRNTVSTAKRPSLKEIQGYDTEPKREVQESPVMRPAPMGGVPMGMPMGAPMGAPMGGPRPGGPRGVPMGGVPMGGMPMGGMPMGGALPKLKKVNRPDVPVYSKPDKTPRPGAEEPKKAEEKPKAHNDKLDSVPKPAGSGVGGFFKKMFKKDEKGSDSKSEKSSGGGDLDKWLVSMGVDVKDIATDFKDGVKLLALIKAMTGDDIPVKAFKPNLLKFQNPNLDEALKYFDSKNLSTGKMYISKDDFMNSNEVNIRNFLIGLMEKFPKPKR